MIKITKNAIQCKHCGDIIESVSAHDFKFCSCGSCAVDGGHDYLRRCCKTSPENDYIDLSESKEISVSLDEFIENTMRKEGTKK